MTRRPNGTWRRRAYVAVLFWLALSGLAQMPIFKRYYIADIPGLGWLARFFVTHWIHYAAAVALLAIAAYTVVDFGLMRRGRPRLTPSGRLRAALLAGLVLSGAALVVRNLPGVYLPHDLIVFLNLAHLGLFGVFAGTAALCLALKKRWTTVRRTSY